MRGGFLKIRTRLLLATTITTRTKAVDDHMRGGRVFEIRFSFVELPLRNRFISLDGILVPSPYHFGQLPKWDGLSNETLSFAPAEKLVFHFNFIGRKRWC
ncbi:hypothetical protein NPIL_217871 [Nephila pilipes]|uniref:Uncharacterized protein n=1 Tax=Nephila pilipes TaxID=299642 RepID=A0A8X6PBQ1_NEPPI|nr:hypothetical protein NPIL_217871 [Nephila pilipes]